MRPAALFDERSDRQVSCGSPESLAPRAKMHGFAAVDDVSTIRLPHDACVCRGELASDWCEKPVLTARCGPRAARLRLLALDRGLVFTTYSKIARRDGPEPAWGAFRGPIGVPCVTPPSRRPSSSEPSARGSGREKTLRRADGAAVGRTKRARCRQGKKARRFSSMREPARRAGVRTSLRAHFDCASVKRHRRPCVGR